MGSLRLILGLVAALAIASFGVINMEPVTVAYYRGTLRLPLFYVLLAVFAGGFLLAWVGGVFDRLRFYRKIHALRREVKTLESGLEAAREESGRLLAPAPEGPLAPPSGALPPGGAASPSPLAEGAFPAPQPPAPAPGEGEDKDVAAR